MQDSRAEHVASTVRGRAWRALLEVSRDLLQALDAELRRAAELDLQQYDVLLHVSEGVGGRRMTDLAEAVVLSKSGLTSVVDRMEREGLLERRPDPSDRRATRVVLSARGSERFREATEIHRDIVHRIFTFHITDEEADAILEALTRVGRELGGGGRAEADTSASAAS